MTSTPPGTDLADSAALADRTAGASGPVPAQRTADSGADANPHAAPALPDAAAVATTRAAPSPGTTAPGTTAPAVSAPLAPAPAPLASAEHNAPSASAPSPTAAPAAAGARLGSSLPSDGDAARPDADGWQRLPARAIPLCTIDISLALAVVAAIAATVAGVLAIGRGAALFSGLAGALFGAGIGLWIGFRRYRNTLWRLDAHGFAVRRGVAWQRETIVPLTRVQHLDLKHGPLQRLRRLATLVVHTAGTRHNAVAIDHLDADDAQRLRERLGRQLDHEEDSTG